MPLATQETGSSLFHSKPFKNHSVLSVKTQPNYYCKRMILEFLLEPENLKFGGLFLKVNLHRAFWDKCCLQWITQWIPEASIPMASRGNMVITFTFK